MALVFYHVYMRMRTTLLFRNGCVGELVSCFRKSCFSQGRTWSSVVNVSSLSVSLHFFFLSFLHFLSDPISFSLFFLTFFHSLNRQRPLKSKRTQAQNGEGFKEHPIMNQVWPTHPFQGPSCLRQQTIVQL